jgi:hypothetical protein
MKKFVSLVVASAAFTALAVGSAQATPITFNFAQFDNPVGQSTVGVSSITFTNILSGLSVVATAQVGNVNTTKVRPSNEGGLGVNSVSGDNPQVDGSGILDVLNLTFSSGVKIRSAVFTFIKPSEKVSFGIDGNPFGTLTGISSNYVFGGDAGTLFSFGSFAKSDAFKLASISVSPVPLPPALLLFASGLFGIGLLGRRRNKAI